MITCTHDTITAPEITPEITQAIETYRATNNPNPAKLMKAIVSDPTVPNADTACRILTDTAPFPGDPAKGWCNMADTAWKNARKGNTDTATTEQPLTADDKKRKAAIKNARKESTLKSSDKRAICPVGVTSDYSYRYAHFMRALTEYEDNNGKTIFARGTDVVTAGNGKFFKHTIDTFALEAAQRIVFVEENDKGKITLKGPQGDLIKTLIAQGNTSTLPKVKRFSNTPYFAADGTLVQEPGYHAASEILYINTGLAVPTVPAQPTLEEIEKAKTILMDDLLGDFPFVTKADMANAVAYNINPYVRNMIDGPSPLFAFESTTERTGKTLLMDVSTMHAIGEHYKTVPAPEERKEWGKNIVATLREGAIIAAFDNVNDKINSGVLASALTAWPMCQSRILGVSENAELPAPTGWAVTGNNLKFSGEIAKRTVPIKQDAQMERPELRTGFRHPKLRRWAKDHRAELVWACLTLAQAWVAAGRPEAPDAPQFGGFEDWTETMAGILHNAGIEGLLCNRDEFLNSADDDYRIWSNIVAEWARLRLEGPASLILNQVFMTVSFAAKDENDEEVRASGYALDLPAGIDLRDGITRSVSTKFSAELQKVTGKWFDGYRINYDNSKKGRPRYYLSTRETSD